MTVLYRATTHRPSADIRTPLLWTQLFAVKETWQVMTHSCGPVAKGTTATAIFTSGPAPDHDGVLISSSAAACVGGS
jgi:hypothetical protein